MTRRIKWITLALLLALAGAVLFRFWRMSDPDAVLAEAQRKLWNERSLRYGIAIDYRGAFEEATSTAVTAFLRTDADLDDPAEIASVSLFEMRAGTGSAISSLAGETRRLEGTHYLKLAKATGAYEKMAEPVLEHWTSDQDPLLERVLTGSERIPAAESFGLLRAKAVPTMRTLVRRVETLVDERAGSRKFAHYRIAAEEGAAAALFEYATRASQGLDRLPAEDERLLRAIVAAWGAPEGEVWIDRATGRFAKISLVGRVAGERIKGDARFTIVFSREGLPVEVETPSDARDIDDVLGGGPDKHLSLAGERVIDPKTGASGGRLPTSSSTSTRPQIAPPLDSDKDGLVDTQEFFYGSDAWNPDTDADGWIDGEEVKKGQDPAGPGVLFGFGL